MSVWWLAASANNGDCSYIGLKGRKVLAQGWPYIGDLSAIFNAKRDEKKLKKLLHALIDYCYPDKADKVDPNPEKRFMNLLNIQVGDIVVICEGLSIKGLAKITTPLSYSYYNNNGAYEYAHQFGSVTEWKDWDVSKVGPAPRPHAQGPKGVEQCHKDATTFINAWNKL